MKADIHPEIREVIFQDTASGTRFKLLSAVKTRETVDVDGQQYPLFRCDISSASHPFYTGEQRILDTTGRVEKFGSKFGSSFGKKLLKKK